MNPVFVLVISFIAALSLVSCSDTDQPRGRLSISLTDGPVEASKVVIHFTGATVQPETGDSFDIVITDPDTNQATGRSIDLLEFTGINSTVLFNEQLLTGNYSWIRLDMDFDPAKSYIQTPDGGQHALVCTSCENDGLKLNHSFDVSVSHTTVFMLDFELDQSITEAGGIYKFMPAVRIIETATSGYIVGSVDSTLMSDNGGADGGCVVYVYEGSDIQADDIYILDNGDIPADHNSPVSTTAVDLTTIDLTTNTYPYTAAFLPAGEYTVSLTCDAELDSAELDDNISFIETSNATVLSGLYSTVDFPAP